MSKRREQVASASMNNSSQTPLNDDGWNAFVMPLIYDQEGGTEDNTINIAKNPLFELISSGIRQKFAVIQKSELITWAIANSKNYDICKEVKSLVDSNAGVAPSDIDFPYSLLARLLKVKLLILKEEGVEKKAAYKANTQETTDANVADSLDPKKAVKKEDKKDERVKSSNNKKPTKAPAPGKPNEAPSRPDSASNQTEGGSKRKTKLREKGSGKSDSKPSALSDEPADGPDAYYVLQGFESLDVLTAIMDETEVPVHVLIRVTGAPQDGSRILISQINNSMSEADSIKSLGNIPAAIEYPNYMESKDDNIQKLVAQIGKSTETSLWRQVAWADVFANNARDYKEMFDMIAQAAYSTLDKKKQHENYYTPELQINIPTLDSQTLSKIDLKYYDCLHSTVTSERAIDAELVCAFLLEHVCRLINADAGPGNNSSLSQSEEMGVLEYHLEHQIERLGINQSKSSTFNAEFGVTDSIGQSEFAFHGDLHALFSRNLDRLAAFDLQPKDILANMRSLYPMSKYYSILAAAFARLSEESRKRIAREQLLLQTELAGFTKVPPQQLARILLQLDFEKMLDTTHQLNEYCWVESYSPSALNQILESFGLSFKNIVAKYSPNNSAVLLALKGPGQIDVRHNESTKEDMIRTKLGFGLWCDLLNRKNTYLANEVAEINAILKTEAEKSFGDATSLSETPKLQTKVAVYNVGDKVVQYIEKTTNLYASNSSILQVIDTTSRHAGDDYRVQLGWNENSLTWGSATKSKVSKYLNVTSKSNHAFAIYEKKSETGDRIIVQGSSPDGLYFEFLENGNVVLKRFSSQMTDFTSLVNGFINAPSDKASSSRVCTPAGTTLLYNNDQTVFYQKDGGIHVLNADKKWVSTKQNGQRLASNVTGESLENLSNIRTTREYHPSLNRLHILREDYVNITLEGIVPDPHSYVEPAVLRPTESRVEFGDGTHIRSQYDGNKLLFVTTKHPNFGSLTFNNDGKTTRLELNDGTVIERNTLEDGTSDYSIQLSDCSLGIRRDGTATFQPITSPSKQDQIGVHRINWMEGSYSFLDFDGSLHQLSSQGEARIGNIPEKQGNSEQDSWSLNLSELPVGKLVENLVLHFSEHESHASTDLFNAPKLFVVYPDGTGLQLLRDKDLYLYFKDQLMSELTEIAEEKLDSEPGSTAVNIITSSDSKTFLEEKSSQLIVFRQLIRHPQLNKSEREKIEAEIAQFVAAKKSMHEKSNDIAAQISKLTYEQPAELSATNPLVFGANKKSTENALLEKFKLKKVTKKPITPEDLRTQKVTRMVDSVLSTRPRIILTKNKRKELEHHRFNDGAPRPNTATMVSALVKTKTLSAESLPDESYEIPKYFESEEGRAFLRKNRSAKTPRKGQKVQVSQTNAAPKKVQDDALNFRLNVAPPAEGDQGPMNPKQDKELKKTEQVSPAKTATKTEKSESSSPGVQPNLKYLKAEAKTRRKLATSSTAVLKEGKERPPVSFETESTVCQFGQIQPNSVNKVNFYLTNVGNDIARFKVKQPPTESGVVIKYQPGPVAPGMRLKLTAELDGSKVTSKTSKGLETTFKVVTETEVLCIPVKAIL